jgi:lysophospholipase L1-like esterase
MHPRSRLAALAIVGMLGTAACGSSDAAAPPGPDTVGGIGQLPGTVAPSVPASTEPGWWDPTPVEPGSVAADRQRLADETRSIGRLVVGNRVLVIGDSILASISERYDNQLCDGLVPRGWVVQVDAEVSRSIEFGRRVLGRHEGEEWDAAVVMLGNNYDGDPDIFARELDSLLDELQPWPVVLVNVTRFEPEQDEVNYILAATADERDGVRLLDWSTRTAEDTPGAERLLSDDGLHLSTTGQAALAAMISSELGSAPAGSQGACLWSPFRDDDGGSLPEPES